MTSRKHCATDKNQPPLPFPHLPRRGLYQMLLAVSTDRQKNKRETDVACVNSSNRKLCSLVRPLGVLFSHFGHCFSIQSRPDSDFSVVFPATPPPTPTTPFDQTLTTPGAEPPQYIFCRLGSTASLRKENTRRIPDLFPLLPLVK